MDSKDFWKWIAIASGPLASILTIGVEFRQGNIDKAAMSYFTSELTYWLGLHLSAWIPLLSGAVGSVFAWLGFNWNPDRKRLLMHGVAAAFKILPFVGLAATIIDWAN